MVSCTTKRQRWRASEARISIYNLAKVKRKMRQSLEKQKQMAQQWPLASHTDIISPESFLLASDKPTVIPWTIQEKLICQGHTLPIWVRHRGWQKSERLSIVFLKFSWKIFVVFPYLLSNIKRGHNSSIFLACFLRNSN